MEVSAGLPQVAWGSEKVAKPVTKDIAVTLGNGYHVNNDTGINRGNSEHDTVDGDDNPPPLPITLPPSPPLDYHGNTTTNSVSPESTLSHSGSNSSDLSVTPPKSADSNPSPQLDFLEQLKSSSTSKLLQLQKSVDEESVEVGVVELTDRGGEVCVVIDEGVTEDECGPTLSEELLSLRKEVASLKEQNQHLLALRGQMDGEIENLTSSLFEEAYKMVNDAKRSRNVAEKQLAVANGKIDALEAEVITLRALLKDDVAVPKAALPPSVAGGGSKKVLNRKLSVLKHQRSNSNGGAAQSVIVSSPTGDSGMAGYQGTSIEIDEQELHSFTKWLEGMSMDSSDPFIGHILSTDVVPCLSFTNQQLSSSLLTAVQQNSLQMELLTTISYRLCSLTMCKNTRCGYRMRLDDSDQWHYISMPARNKIASVCNFFMFLRHVQQGLIKTDNKSTYTELCKLRASMHLVRLGVHTHAT